MTNGPDGKSRKASLTESKVVALFWVRREDWERYKSIVTDASILPATYETWLKAAEQGFDYLTDRGIEVLKAEVDLNAFLVWCKAQALEPDGQARIRYANEIAAALVLAQDNTKY